jgi:ADP-ribose pyrophosphatase YjhB (NUDIX family)
MDAQPATWTAPNRLQRILVGDERSVGHLHGHWLEHQSVVLGIRSYDQLLGSLSAQTLQQAMGVMKTMLFVGVGEGLTDPNWSALFRFLRPITSISEYRHFRLCRESELDALRAIHESDGIYPLVYGKELRALAPFLERLKEDAGTAKPAMGAAKAPDSKSATVKAADIPVALGFIANGSKVLLVQRRQIEGDLEWGFPAGFVKPGRNPREEIREEVLSETGLTCRVVAELGERVHPATGVRCIYYRMRVLDGTLTNGDPSENLTVEWVEATRVYDYIDEEDVFQPIREQVAALQDVGEG